MFRDQHPLAWTFHRNTSRWRYNLLGAPDDPVTPAPFKEYLDAPLVPLPAAQFPATSLAEALAGRLSCRRFAGAALPLQHLATLLQAAYGVQNRFLYGDAEFLERPVPSGGGLYPLEIYLFAQRVAPLAPGLYHYAPLPHALEHLAPLVPPAPVTADLFLGQPYAAQAAVIVILAAQVERTMHKYGDRGYRYILLEAGHLAQNLNLMATALGLGSFNMGGFFDTELAAVLGLDVEHEVPVYALALGQPVDADRDTLRQPPAAPAP